MEIFIKLVQFFLSLTLLITVHEFGHFIVAHLFKIRVTKFYIFFDWGFSLCKFRRGETEYGLGWLPLGGYCQIAGMVDETQNASDLAAKPQPWEFRSKPAWQRFLVLVAGVTMNLLMAFVIYCGISYAWGSSYIANEDLTYGYNFNEKAESLGFRDGDRVVCIGGEHIVKYNTILTKVLLADEATNVVVVRNGERVRFTMPYEQLNELRNEGDFAGFYEPRIPFIIDSVVSAEALTAGLMRGDRIVGIDDVAEDDFAAYNELLTARAGQEAVLAIERGCDTLKIAVPINADGMIGVIRDPYLHPRTEHYSLFGSISAGARLTTNTLKEYWQQLKMIVKPDTGLYKQVGGFISIANIFPTTWDWHRFWSMTAFLSIILAIMNIIPIPGLDGGHTLFTLWEMVTRRKVNDKVLEVAQYVGLALILLLLVFANGNDIYRLFK